MKLIIFAGMKKTKPSINKPPTAEMKVYLLNLAKSFIVSFNMEKIIPKNKKSNAHDIKKIIGNTDIPLHGCQ
jgi:hypothetical protein